MKIFVAAIIGIIATTGVGCAQTYDRAVQNEQQSQEERNLEILSKRLIKMKREMDKFVKEMSASYSDASSDYVSGAFGSDVKVDVIENEKSFTVTADLPGMDKDKIDILLEGGKTLKISGMRHVEKNETAPGVVKQERMEGRFERVLELPAECKSEGITASYKNGVLDIVIPKKEPVKVQSVKVRVQ